MAFEDANDEVASKQSIFSKYYDDKSYFRVTVNPYVPIFWSQMWVVAETNDTHTHAHKTTTATLAAHVHQGLKTSFQLFGIKYWHRIFNACMLFD